MLSDGIVDVLSLEVITKLLSQTKLQTAGEISEEIMFEYARAAESVPQLKDDATVIVAKVH
jgi:serine/threonine protein phosphatase PrpC